MKIKAGYKLTEVGVIPEDWEVKELGEIANIVRGASPRPIEDPKWFDENSPIGWVRISDVTKSIKSLTATTQKLSKLGIQSSRYVDEGNLIMSICATVGRPILTKLNVCIHDGFVVFRNPKIEINYLYYFLSYIEGDWSKNGQTGSQMNLNTTLINTTQIPIPLVKERIAIATALSDADDLISSLEKLIAKKRNIKQGAMQKLLQPKDDWEVKKLGEVCDIKKGQLITDSTRVNGNIPVIAGGKMPAYFHNKPNRLGKTITISGSGANAGYIAFHDYPIFASDCSTIGEKENYSIQYIYYLMQSLQEKIYKMQTGGAQPHIHPSDLNPITIPFPPKEEQAKIATILSDMDAEITALETKLEKYRKIKLGMMQNLLTGKIRLI
ncbi:MAG: hypothetical protein RLZZ293_1090 [Pseudomonadota bacterium]|jgi:type I restriction enzyme S subunit